MEVKWEGRDEEADEVEVFLSDEKWNEYQLADGNILMFKEVLVSVHKLRNKTSSGGGPLYQFQTHKVVRVKETGK